MVLLFASTVILDGCISYTLDSFISTRVTGRGYWVVVTGWVVVGTGHWEVVSNKNGYCLDPTWYPVSVPVQLPKFPVSVPVHITTQLPEYPIPLPEQVPVCLLWASTKNEVCLPLGNVGEHYTIGGCTSV